MLSEEEIEAYDWLCALEVNSEAEATNKEICLDLLNKYKFDEYFRRKKEAEAWKIR